MDLVKPPTPENNPKDSATSPKGQSSTKATSRSPPSLSAQGGFINPTSPRDRRNTNTTDETNSARKRSPTKKIFTGTKKNTAKRSTGCNKGTESEIEDSFEDHAALEKRIQKTLYYAGRLPSSSRPSFPLTILAVNAFTSGSLGIELNTLDFLDFDMASEVGRNACVSPTAVIMALVYLDRLAKNSPKYLSNVKPSELFVVALLVASKFEQDEGEHYGVNNSDWVEHVGFDKKRLNHLEINFLAALDWNVKINLDEYMEKLAKVEATISRSETKNRDCMTYTEITTVTDVFLPWESFWPIIYTYAIQVVTIACISYLTLVATLMTSCLMTPELVKITRSVMTTLSHSITTESPLFFQTPMDPINLFQDIQACKQLKIESIIKEIRFDSDSTGTDPTSQSSNASAKWKGNSTGYEFISTLQSLLFGFQPPNLNPGRGTTNVLGRKNYLYTVA